MDKHASNPQAAVGQSVAPAGVHRTELALEICRGRTQFPVRPIAAERFLIGSGKRCDLRLGGAVPPLHSIIYRDGNDVWLDVIASKPAVKVNGRTAQCVRLRDGDLIEIASFQFHLRSTIHTTRQAVAAKAAHISELPEEIETSLAEMSAAELVERLAQELEDVDEFDDQRETGAEALLAAALELDEEIELQEAHPAAIPMPDRLGAATPDQAAFLGEIEELVGGLTAFSAFLEMHSQSIEEQMQTTNPVIAEMLTEAQRRLVARLETVQKQLAAESRFPNQTRASA